MLVRTVLSAAEQEFQSVNCQLRLARSFDGRGFMRSATGRERLEDHPITAYASVNLLLVIGEASMGNTARQLRLLCLFDIQKDDGAWMRFIPTLQHDLGILISWPDNVSTKLLRWRSCAKQFTIKPKSYTVLFSRLRMRWRREGQPVYRGKASHADLGIRIHNFIISILQALISITKLFKSGYLNFYHHILS